jgi:tripartite ATP-independent transporter DctM subunit
MQPEIVGLIGMAALLILIASRMWIGYAMAIVGFLGITYIRGFDQAFSLLGSVPFQNVNSYTITVIPMFTLMGMIIAETEIGSDLFKAAYRWIGHFKGGLASATVVACGMMGAITGSHMSGTVIMSKIALPEMKKYNYDDRLASGSIAAGAPLSIIIPPSLAFVMYGILTEESIGKLFMAGIIPGILQIVIYSVLIYMLCKYNSDLGPSGPVSTMKEKLGSLKGILPMIILFMLVLGGIYSGFFTPTESGAVGALGAIIIAMVNRQLTVNKFIESIRETAFLTGSILLLLGGTFMFISFITISKLPFFVTGFVTGLNVPVLSIILVIGLMYIILGFFLPEIPMMILTVPILFPTIVALGINPIWFGVFVVKMMVIGAITPPIGMVVFLLSGVSKIPINTIFRGVVPFLAADLVIVALLIAFPDMALILTDLMG